MPAPDSTRIVWPCAFSFLVVSGVAATRVSPADDSRGGFRFGALSLADIAIAAFFRNAGWVRFQIDAARWPRAAAWMARTLAEPAFAKLARIEDAVLRTPIAEQRDALRSLGAPVSADTYAGPAPRRGVMPT